VQSGATDSALALVMNVLFPAFKQSKGKAEYSIERDTLRVVIAGCDVVNASTKRAKVPIA
jgi:hypothetical protein